MPVSVLSCSSSKYIEEVVLADTANVEKGTIHHV